ncbi:MAG: DUF6599 family protein [Candidatus Poribacteria bacterium]
MSFTTVWLNSGRIPFVVGRFIAVVYSAMVSIRLFRSTQPEQSRYYKPRIIEEKSMLRILSTIFILTFIIFGCHGKENPVKYTAVVAVENYVAGVWDAKNSKTAINQTRKLLNKISSKEAEGFVVTDTRAVNLSNASKATKLKPADMLPKSDQVKDWKRAGEIEIYTEKNLIQFMHDETEVYHAYGFVELALAEYHNPKLGPKPLLRVEIHDMGAPENAFGVYSFNRNPEADFEIIGNETAVTMLTFDTWKGRYFVHIRLYEFSDDIREGAQNILRYIMNQIRGTTKPPDILKLLPRDHFVRHSERYFWNHTILNKIHFIADENILMLNESTIGLTAEYLHPKPENPTDTLTVFLIRYPTQKDATRAYDSYKARLLAKGYSTITTKKLGAQSAVIQISVK